MPDAPGRRRPLAWNAILSKGHAHVTSRSAARSAAREETDSLIDEYFASDDDVADTDCAVGDASNEE